MQFKVAVTDTSFSKDMLTFRTELERHGIAVTVHDPEVRDPAQLANDWLLPLRGALRAGQVTRVELDFADGHRLLLTAAQRWRFWRRSKSAML